MVLYCGEFLASPCVSAIIHIPAASMRLPIEGNVVCYYACIAGYAATTLLPI